MCIAGDTFSLDKHSVFSPLEHSFDAVDLLHTRLELLFVNGSLYRLSSGILYSICWWFSRFHCCNGKHLFCPIGCKSLFKCTFLPHYTHLIPNVEFRRCSFSSIDFGIECIFYVYSLLACVHLCALARSIDDVLLYFSIIPVRTSIYFCVLFAVKYFHIIFVIVVFHHPTTLDFSSFSLE